MCDSMYSEAIRYVSRCYFARNLHYARHLSEDARYRKRNWLLD